MNESTTTIAHSPDAFRRGAWLFGAACTVFAALAALAAQEGVFARLPPPVIPAFVLTLTGALCLWYRRSASLRAFALGVPLWAPVLFHVVRAFIGAAFLFEYAQGRLPASFAYHAGIGDIISGVLALVVLLPLQGRTRRRAVWTWNLIALVDIATVVVGAQVTVLSGDTLLRAAFAIPPYGAIPFLLVLVFGTHILVFARLRREAAAEQSAKRA